LPTPFLNSGPKDFLVTDPAKDYIRSQKEFLQELRISATPSKVVGRVVGSTIPVAFPLPVDKEELREKSLVQDVFQGFGSSGVETYRI
jgi:hypothetical protein